MIENTAEIAGQCVLVGLYLVSILAWIDRMVFDYRSCDENNRSAG